jgi:hypothetical protein
VYAPSYPCSRPDGRVPARRHRGGALSRQPQVGPPHGPRTIGPLAAWHSPSSRREAVTTYVYRSGDRPRCVASHVDCSCCSLVILTFPETTSCETDGRPVRARRLSDHEGQTLTQIVRRGRSSSIRVRRATMIIAGVGESGRGDRPAGRRGRGHRARRHPRIQRAAELARAARPIRRGQGRRDPRAATRGRRVASNHSAPDADAGRPGVPQRAGQAAAHPATPAPAGLITTLLRWHAQLVAHRWTYP